MDDVLIRIVCVRDNDPDLVDEYEAYFDGVGGLVGTGETPLAAVQELYAEYDYWLTTNDSELTLTEDE